MSDDKHGAGPGNDWPEYRRLLITNFENLQKSVSEIKTSMSKTATANARTEERVVHLSEQVEIARREGQTANRQVWSELRKFESTTARHINTLNNRILETQKYADDAAAAAEARTLKAQGALEKRLAQLERDAPKNSQALALLKNNYAWLITGAVVLYELARLFLPMLKSVGGP